MDGHIRNRLTIQQDPRLLKAANETAVGEPMLPGSGIDPDNPEAAEIPFARPSIPVGIDAGPHDRGRGCSELFTVASSKALRSLQYLVSSSPGLKASFYPWHGSTSFMALTKIEFFKFLNPSIRRMG
jgi:hypothetical protein